MPEISSFPKPLEMLYSYETEIVNLLGTKDEPIEIATGETVISDPVLIPPILSAQMHLFAVGTYGDDTPDGSILINFLGSPDGETFQNDAAAAESQDLFATITLEAYETNATITSTQTNQRSKLQPFGAFKTIVKNNASDYSWKIWVALALHKV